MKRFALLIIVIAGIVLILRSGIGIASASERETELFNKGYEYLFSYKPDKAAETFRIFLKEFPESSARDAALFWLGKTLISMKLYSEAELTFQTIQKEFPDSPFIVFLDIEIKEIAKLQSTEHTKEAKEPSKPQKDIVPKEATNRQKSEETDSNLTQVPTGTEKAESLIEEVRKANHERRLRLSQVEVLAEEQGKELGKLTAELDQFRSQVSDLQIEKKHLSDRVESMEWQAEQRIRDMRILNAYLTKLMFQKKEAPQQKPDTKAAEERDKLKAALEEERKNISDLRGQLAVIKEQQARPQTLQDMPSAPLHAPGAVVRIRNRDYPLIQIIDHQISASQVFKRFGIKDIAWRTGNSLDDFLSEELLLLEAKKTNITIDTKKQKELVESHKLSAAEADYLEKFMIIARYIDTQYTESPTEKWIELISVVYKPGDAAAKTVLATDLQKAAREGKPFEEIGKMHPERVNFSRLSIQEFSAKYKDKSQLLQKLNFLKEETVVIWSDKGYMLIKPVSGRVPFNPFIEMKAAENDKIRSFVKKYIDELKKKN